MSSREEILANIRKNTQKRFDYPEWEIKATTYPDIIEKFCEVSRVVGGEAVLLGKGEDIMRSFAVLIRMPVELLRIWMK